MVDAYTLVFAALLFTSGSLGDRLTQAGTYHRVGVFRAGFAGDSFSVNPEMLIAPGGNGGGRGAIARYSVDHQRLPPQERGKAIGIWAGMLGISIPLGPVISGILLEIFWWGSVFIINVPITVVALGLGRGLVPESRDSTLPVPTYPRCSRPVLSCAYGVISA